MYIYMKTQILKDIYVHLYETLVLKIYMETLILKDMQCLYKNTNDKDEHLYENI